MLMVICIALSGQTLSGMEYFFDTDPGAGNGTSLSISNGDTVDVSFNIPTNTLSPGFHILYIRAVDVNGTWSLYHRGTVWISEPTLQSSSTGITELEYFIDTDPGAGNGTSISLLEVDTLELIQSLEVSGLTPGPHQFCMRARNEDGVWSLYHNRILWVSDSSERNEAPKLTNSEFFFDTDPGAGSGLVYSIPPTDSCNDITSVSTAGLAPGFHALHVRKKDEDRHWGLYHTGIFYIGDSVKRGEAPPLVGLEYFYGADPGVGNGNYIAFPATDTLDDWFQFPTTGLGIGTHPVSVRVKDEQGTWSFILVDTFEIQSGCGITPSVSVNGPLSFCEGDSVQLSTNSAYASYLWSTGDTTSSIWVTQSGNYTVHAIDTSGCSGNSFPTTVNVGAAINGVIIPDAEVLCEFSSMTIAVSQPYLSYLWSTGDTTATININAGGSYSVTVTNADGCSKSLNPVMIQEEPQPPQPMVEQVAPDSLRSDLVGPSYRWYRDFMQLPDVGRTIHATESGEYQVSIISTNGCQSDKADPFLFTATALEELTTIQSLRIYPNPSSGIFTLSWESLEPQEIHISIVNSVGQLVSRQGMHVGTGSQQRLISLKGEASGIYMLTLITRKGQLTQRLMLH